MAVKIKIVNVNTNKATLTLEEVSSGKQMVQPYDIVLKVAKAGQIELTNAEIVNGQIRISADVKVDGKSAKEESKPSVESVKKANTNTTAIKAEPKKSANPQLDEMKSLVAKLNEARKVYEQGTDEIMSNKEYDALYDKLAEMEKATGIYLADSPTQNVGYEVVSALEKHTHETPMLSLDKTKSREELVGWLGDKEGVLSWKLDGLTVVVTYNNGELESAVTRGNGQIGEVITNNAKQFKNLPRKIPFTGKLVLRGEALIGYKTFEKINSQIPAECDKYKNPRNLCSGTVRQLNSGIVAERDVKWKCFELISADGYNERYVDKQFDFVESLGFEVVEHYNVNSKDLIDRINFFSKAVANSDDPSDGLVITYNDKVYGLSLGKTAKAYRHSMAFKWQDETATTKMVDVIWQVGRTGVITPVAIFEPIDIEGSTVERASVHNVSIFNELALGYGDTVSVYKANMIIPQIDQNFTMSGTFKVPDVCPCCGYPTEIVIEPSSGVETLYCTNDDCAGVSINKFKHFVKRDCMDIKGVSESTLQTFIDFELITNFASIYHLSEHEDTILQIEGFGERSFEKIIDAIEDSRKVKIHNFIFALGIPEVGLSTARLICEHFDNNLDAVVNATYGDLIEIDGVGDAIATSFTDWFEDADNIDEFTELIQELEIEEPEAAIDSSMSGVTFCVTGKVYKFSSRDVIKNLVIRLGGKLASSVSSSTNFLVTNDTTSGSKKNVTAQKLGIPIITEDEFIERFNLSQYIE